ncbi:MULTISPECIES: HNH endonuclease [Pseudomonas]|uniref:HNH endonuclease n=1 Tax=Pseudomonas fulva TaxID=47880 RepID=A0A0D0L0W3_9PSED|nr:MULTISPECIES: HNH endonuclease [Pseudomonas]KIQ04467.1 HNH endonuclease [Pseudomonas fulva]
MVQRDSEQLRQHLLKLIDGFGLELSQGDLREKVVALVPAFRTLRDLGCSLVPVENSDSARDRIITYLKKYPRTLISGDELMVVSGIGEWARRVRELRVEYGWNVITGITAREMFLAGDLELKNNSFGKNDYVLLAEKQDREAAFRWNSANSIRTKKGGAREKMLEFLKLNEGRAVTGEELRYVANDTTEWARRVRELRTEEGWSVVTRTTGRPDLPIGVYMLEDLHQTPHHDRKISDRDRAIVLARDEYTCTVCKWNQSKWHKSDPRHLELHHVHHHAKGGDNSVDNLITLCTSCHVEIHKRERS